VNESLELKVDAVQPAVRVQVDPRVGLLGGLVGAARAMSDLEQGGQCERELQGSAVESQRCVEAGSGCGVGLGVVVDVSPACVEAASPRCMLPSTASRPGGVRLRPRARPGRVTLRPARDVGAGRVARC
jgi:hypothetical protein